MVGCGGCSGRFFGRFDDGRMRSPAGTAATGPGRARVREGPAGVGRRGPCTHYSESSIGSEEPLILMSLLFSSSGGLSSKREEPTGTERRMVVPSKRVKSTTPISIRVGLSLDTLKSCAAGYRKEAFENISFPSVFSSVFPALQS